MEIRAIGSSSAGVRSAVDSGVVPQQAQNTPSEQVSVQMARAVPQSAAMESMGTTRKPADSGGAEQFVSTDVGGRLASGQSRVDGQKRGSATETVKPSGEERGRVRLPGSNRQPESAAVQNEATKQAELERTQQAVDDIAESFSSMATGLELSVDEDLGRVIVKITDPETQEVIKQIPSEDAVALAKSLGKMTGLLLKAKA